MELSELLPIIAPLLFIQLILIIVALTDLIKRPRALGAKWIWAIIIVVVNLIGPILYFIIGRRDG
jgi:uncharacterized membrane protein YhaH (DUF805 family)